MSLVRRVIAPLNLIPSPHKSRLNFLQYLTYPKGEHIERHRHPYWQILNTFVTSSTLWMVLVAAFGVSLPVGPVGGWKWGSRAVCMCDKLRSAYQSSTHIHTMQHIIIMLWKPNGKFLSIFLCQSIFLKETNHKFDIGKGKVVFLNLNYKEYLTK